jgi:transposase InsO family protein
LPHLPSYLFFLWYLLSSFYTFSPANGFVHQWQPREANGASRPVPLCWHHVWAQWNPHGRRVTDLALREIKTLA